MKESEVPQDDANMFEGKTKQIQYALNEEGKYVKVKSVGFEASNIAIEQAWEEVNESIKEALEEVKSGKKSPIYYYMRKEIMDVGILAESVNIAKWRVKRHFKPKVFSKLSKETLEKYRIVFSLESIESLKQVSGK